MSLDFSLEVTYDISYDNKKTFDRITKEVYTRNITHNLTRMAKQAGLHKALWRPCESEFYKASDIIDILEDGLKELKSNPSKYKKLDSPNGWGIYIHFVHFVESVLEACNQFPSSRISVSV